MCEEEERNIADLFGFGGMEGKEKKERKEKEKNCRLDSVSISEEGGRRKEEGESLFFYWIRFPLVGSQAEPLHSLDSLPICRLPPIVPPSLQLPTGCAELLDTFGEFLFGVGFEIRLEKRNPYKFSIPFLYNL